MSDNTKKYKRYFNNSIKLDLSYNCLMNQNELFDILKDAPDSNYSEKIREITNPFFELLGDYKSLKAILANNDINRMEYLYLNRKKINSILYDADETIRIDSNDMKNFFDYYHLCYMINESSEIMNYIFDFSLIMSINDLQIQAKGIKKLFLAKMVIYLIKNYKTLEIYDPKKERDCEDMIKVCNNVINKEKEEFNKNKNKIIINELDNEDLGIDKLYCGILVSLIKNNKLNEENGETLNLLNELEIKNLRLNKIIFEGLKEVLIAENLQNYLIMTYEDLFNEEKLSFYYLLFNFILKSSDYIFHIPFLYDTRKKIIEIINKNEKKLVDDLKKLKKDPKINKLEAVLNYFIELRYYREKLKKPKQNKEPQSSVSNSENLKIESNQSAQSNQSSISQNQSQSQSNNSAFNSSSDLSKNISSISSDPFNTSSFQKGKQENPNSFSNYESNPQIQINIKGEQAYQILSNSTFTLIVDKKSEQDKANVTFKEITYKIKENDPDQKIDFEDVKNIKSDDVKLNTNYTNFIQFLAKVESELKAGYKKPRETKIDLKFEMKNDLTDNYNINCIYFIHDNNLEENDFKEENFLNCNNNYSGLNCMITALSED